MSLTTICGVTVLRSLIISLIGVYLCQRLSSLIDCMASGTGSDIGSGADCRLYLVAVDDTSNSFSGSCRSCLFVSGVTESRSSGTHLLSRDC